MMVGTSLKLSLLLIHRASKSYIILPIDVADLGFKDFLLDTGSSGALITGTSSSFLFMLFTTPRDSLHSCGVLTELKTAPAIACACWHCCAPNRMLTQQTACCACAGELRDELGVSAVGDVVKGLDSTGMTLR
jgi:hypothetical protein